MKIETRSARALHKTNNKFLVCLSTGLFKKPSHEFKLKSANQINHLYFYIYSKCAVFKTDVVGLTGSCYFTAEDDMG